MKTQKLFVLAVVLAIAAIWAISASTGQEKPMAAGTCGPGGGCMTAEVRPATMPAGCRGEKCPVCKARAEKLAEATEILQAVAQKLRGEYEPEEHAYVARITISDRQEILAPIRKAVQLLNEAQGVMAGNASDAVVNKVCPIMDKAIDPAKVPENLTRMYKGQKVGFCCGGCPAAWDKLSDAEKDAKLEKSIDKK